MEWEDYTVKWEENVCIRGYDNTKITGANSNNDCWAIDGKGVCCSGDIRTLLDYRDFENTTMEAACYSYMFSDCTSLTQAPALPAETLANYCYQSMFYGCTSLTQAPALPVTTLQDFCYRNMFCGCTSLTQIPALPATRLVWECYKSMFSGCTSLKLSSTQTGEYANEYKLGVAGSYGSPLASMFAGTGGTFTGTPESGQTLWTSNEIVR